MGQDEYEQEYERGKINMTKIMSRARWIWVRIWTGYDKHDQDIELGKMNLSKNITGWDKYEQDNNQRNTQPLYAIQP